MKTLIELYDDRAIENVIAPDMFRPERVIYLCPTEIAQDKDKQRIIREFFAHRGWKPELHFYESSLFKADRVLNQLRRAYAGFQDCAFDITGGTDAALFAGGMFSAETGIPTFTYSRKKNSFYNIHNASFAEDKPCTLCYNVEDFFLMTGGTLRKGRVDNSVLSTYMHLFTPFFNVFLRFRRKWNDIIVWMQKASQCDKGTIPPLGVNSSFYVKGERGGQIAANVEALESFEKIGLISKLSIAEERVKFHFRDLNVRNWLRDMGSVLELYAYKACIDSKLFNDVISSAVVDWNGEHGHDSVSNEIDVMASRGVIPLFISCKVCDIKTEALNELAILRDRFGGKGAKAVIVSAEPCNAAARHRAAQLGIAVIDLEELSSGDIVHRIKVIMKAEKV